MANVAANGEIGFSGVDEPSLISGSRWWRASKYEVVGGTHIAPARGASIEIFDPFEAHEEFWGGRRRKDERPPPYVELNNLDATDPWAIAEWCTRYGLLGVLPHRTLAVDFWPSWQRTLLMMGGRLGMGVTATAGTEGVLAVQRHYRQGSGVEEVRYDEVSMGGQLDERPLTSEELEEALERRLGIFGGATLRRPHTLVIDPWSGSTSEAALVQGYARFFPRVDGVTDWETRQRWGLFPDAGKPRSLMGPHENEALEEHLAQQLYPDPLTQEFLREYGEPIHYFHEYAQIVGDVLGRWQRASSECTQEQGRPSAAAQRAELSSIPTMQRVGLRAVHPSAEPVSDENAESRWAPRWRVPSLYAALHVMMLQDFPLGSAIGKYCNQCRKLFVTDDRRQRYCTTTCQKTHSQADRRRRRAEEES